MADNPTFQHLTNSENRNHFQAPQTGIHRQCVELRRISCPKSELAGFIAHEIMQGSVVFPDSNVAISHEWEPFWSLLKTFHRPCCLLTLSIYDELREWIHEPHHNKARAIELRNRLKSGQGVVLFDADKSILPGCSDVFPHYLDVLAYRKFAAIPRRGQQTFDGEPHDRQKVLNGLLKRFGQRTFRIAAKALKHFERTGVLNVNDERLLLSAVMSSLSSGVASIILTGDYDLYETFYKLQYVIDTDYRKWLVATGIKNGIYGDGHLITHEQCKGFFTNDVVIYDQLTPNYSEVMPADYVSVPVSVIYSPPNTNDNFTVTVRFVRDLNGLFWTKATSKGNCTLQFGSKSTEIDLRIMGENFDKKTAVGEVSTVPGYYSPWSISIFNYMTSFMPCERVGAVATRQ